MIKDINELNDSQIREIDEIVEVVESGLDMPGFKEFAEDHGLGEFIDAAQKGKGIVHSHKSITMLNFVLETIKTTDFFVELWKFLTVDESKRDVALLKFNRILNNMKDKVYPDWVNEKEIFIQEKALRAQKRALRAQKRANKSKSSRSSE